MTSPFDAVTPIGQRRGPKVNDYSATQRRRVRQLAKSNQGVAIEGVQAEAMPSAHAGRPPAEGRGRTKAKTPVLTNAEALDQVTQLARKFARLAAEAGKPGDAKHYATATAIMLDKFLLLTNRPTTIHGFGEMTDENRTAVRELALRLVAART